MLGKRTGSKSAQMHRIALERLRRAESARSEYVRHRFDQAVNDAFDAWETEPEEPEAPRGADQED